MGIRGGGSCGAPRRQRRGAVDFFDRSIVAPGSSHHLSCSTLGSTSAWWRNAKAMDPRFWSSTMPDPVPPRIGEPQSTSGRSSIVWIVERTNRQLRPESAAIARLSSVVLRQQHEALLFDEIGIALGSDSVTIETPWRMHCRQLTHA